MEQKKEFKCLRCGRCCLRVSLAVTVPPEDIEKWRRAGRYDILEWSNVLPWGNADIWLNKYSHDDDIPINCPWLRKDDNNKLSCSIQELKPSCCSQYGHDMDHALETKYSFYTGKPFKPTKAELKQIPTVGKWKDFHVNFAIRVPDSEGIDENDILSFIEYRITEEKYYCSEFGMFSDLPPKEILSKLKSAITIFDEGIEED